MTRAVIALALALALPFALPTKAEAVVLGQATTPAGAAFASACAGNNFSGFSNTGDALNGGQNFTAGAAPTLTQLTCSTSTSGVGGTASTGTLTGGGSWNGHGYANSTTSLAQPGQIKQQAQNSGSSNTNFAGAGAQGGWNDQLTYTGGIPGTQGIAAIPLHVHGTLTASGAGARALMFLGVYKNNNRPDAYGGNATAYSLFANANTEFNPYLNQNSLAEGAILFSWDYQMLPYGAVNSGTPSGSLPLLDVDEMVTFFVPFTWGTPFTLGIYAATFAGENASGADATANSASALFQNTITLASGAYVLPANGVGAPSTDFTVTSTSGLNYLAGAEAVPAPPGVAVMGVALLGLGWCRKKAVLF